jgi:hypothetical protein
MAVNATAGLRFLDRENPDLGEARDALADHHGWRSSE